jgi:hypothetical protein
MGEEGPPVLRRSEKEGSHWPPEPSRITAEYIVILSEQIAKLRLHYWGNTDQAEHIGQRTKNVLILHSNIPIAICCSFILSGGRNWLKLVLWFYMRTGSPGSPEYQVIQKESLEFVLWPCTLSFRYFR